MSRSLILSCEHGGKRLPARHRGLFSSGAARRALDSHRGFDPGAARVARGLSRRLAAPLAITTWSRLLVDANRSLHHPQLHSEWVRPLPPEERERIIEHYWSPHRAAVEASVAEALAAAGRATHLSIHSFTPRLAGRVRQVDLGLLYDPSRPLERALARELLADLRGHFPRLRLRCNQPYRGTSDGLTTALRRVFPARRYLGLEIEWNQSLLGQPRVSAAVVDRLVQYLRSL